jgi:CRP-like cAMP-binding protein
MSVASRPSVANALLGALPRKNFRGLSAALTQVTLNFGDQLLEAGKPISHVYFPETALVSLLTDGNRRPVEVGLVGHEGMVGFPLVLGVAVSPIRAIVQGTGTAMRMDRAGFLREFRRSAPLQRTLYRYGHALMTQVAEISACNLLHTVPMRLARWLLMTRDRVRSDEFRVTHEFLGHMLGVRRVGVTQAANNLMKQGLISYGRGTLRIRDGRGLEAASCRCYRVVKALHEPAG